MVFPLRTGEVLRLEEAPSPAAGSSAMVGQGTPRTPVSAHAGEHGEQLLNRGRPGYLSDRQSFAHIFW